MSVLEVVARVEQLQLLVSATTAPGGNGGKDFASQLTAATTAALPAADVAQPLTVTPAMAGTAASGASMSAPGASALPAGVPYGAEITAAARRHGLDPALLAGLVRQESNFGPAGRLPRRRPRAARRSGSTASRRSTRRPMRTSTRS